MPYAVSIQPAAAKALRKLDTSVQKRILDELEELRTDPRPPGSRVLVGYPGWWRLRVGSYRVIYEIRDAELRILVLDVGHRRQLQRQTFHPAQDVFP
jgi:mRNA interferase RelE/StbE